MQAFEEKGLCYLKDQAEIAYRINGLEKHS